MSKQHYVSTVVYWHGEDIECSDPVHDHSPELPAMGEAEAWGRAKANTPSPWPGRNYEDYFDVTEYTEEIDPFDGWPVFESTRRWIFEGGSLVESLTGEAAR